MQRELHPSSQAVRDYVTAVDHLQYSSLPHGTVAVLVTHNNLVVRTLLCGSALIHG
jgi:hypothetical protein